MSEQQTDTRNRTVLGADCHISGQLELDNDAVILGRFEGTLRLTGRLELGRTARIGGTVIAGNVRLAGDIEADVIAEDALELLPEAHLRGRLFARRLIVAPGAEVDGHIHIGPQALEQAAAMLELELSTEHTGPAGASPHAEMPQASSPAPMPEVTIPEAGHEPGPGQDTIAETTTESTETVQADEPHEDRETIEHADSEREPAEVATTIAPPPAEDGQADAPSASEARPTSGAQVFSRNVDRLLESRRPVRVLSSPGRRG